MKVNVFRVFPEEIIMEGSRRHQAQRWIYTADGHHFFARSHKRRNYESNKEKQHSHGPVGSAARRNRAAVGRS